MTVPARWLEGMPFHEVRPHVPTDLPPLPQPPAETLRGVPIADNGDPLIVLPPTLESRHAYAEFGSPAMPSRMWTRQEVAHRLHRADSALPAPFRLHILDTWRSVEAQREVMRLYTEAIPDLGDGYVADPDDPEVPAPHTTGAAVDLTLSINGVGLPMGADFDAFNESAHFLHLEQLPEDAHPELVLARDLRRLLAHTLLAEGFAPIHNEWWHFSYGDQRWAVFRDEPAALYGPIEPESFR